MPVRGPQRIAPSPMLLQLAQAAQGRQPMAGQAQPYDPFAFSAALRALADQKDAELNARFQSMKKGEEELLSPGRRHAQRDVGIENWSKGGGGLPLHGSIPQDTGPERFPPYNPPTIPTLPPATLRSQIPQDVPMGLPPQALPRVGARMPPAPPPAAPPQQGAPAALPPLFGFSPRQPGYTPGESVSPPPQQVGRPILHVPGQLPPHPFSEPTSNQPWAPPVTGAPPGMNFRPEMLNARGRPAPAVAANPALTAFNAAAQGSENAVFPMGNPATRSGDMPWGENAAAMTAMAPSVAAAAGMPAGGMPNLDVGEAAIKKYKDANKGDMYENLLQFGLALMAGGDVQPGATQGPTFAGAFGKAGLQTLGSAKEQSRYTEAIAERKGESALNKEIAKASAARDIHFKTEDQRLKALDISTTAGLREATLAIQDGQNKIANSIHWAQVKATQEGKSFEKVKYMNDIENTFDKQMKHIDTLAEGMAPIDSKMSPEQWTEYLQKQRLDAATRADQNRIAAGEPPTFVKQLQGSGAAPQKAHIDYLRANPKTASEFDAKFGAGAAQQYLGAR